MSIKDLYSIKEITHKETYPFLLKIHYAKRIPSIIYSFGLFFDNKLVGVITFGNSLSYELQKIFQINFNFFELNRLCLINRLEKNVLSYFVSNSLNKLPDNSVIVSYADIDMKHCGYIYQATNWIYTGIGGIGHKSYIMKDNSVKHDRNFKNINLNNVITIKKAIGKHRYFYFKGNRKCKKLFMKILLNNYSILKYPKSKNELYDINNKIDNVFTLDNFI